MKLKHEAKAFCDLLWEAATRQRLGGDIRKSEFFRSQAEKLRHRYEKRPPEIGRTTRGASYSSTSGNSNYEFEIYNGRIPFTARERALMRLCAEGYL